MLLSEVGYTNLTIEQACKHKKGSHRQMSDAGRPVQLDLAQKHTARVAMSSRITRSLLVGIGSVLLLTCLEYIICWLLNPFALAGSATHRLLSTLLLLVHIPLLAIIPFVELIGIFLIVFISLRLLALRAYMKAIDLAGKNYFALTNPLQSFEDLTATTIAYTAHLPDPDLSPQEQSLTLGELTKLQDSSFLLLGAPGSGKSTALHAYQYIAAQQRSAITQRQRKLPVFLSLNDYGLFMQAYQRPVPALSSLPMDENAGKHAQALTQVRQQVTLLDFLYHGGNVAGIDHLRPYLTKMMAQGDFLFLCDGLDEVGRGLRGKIAQELVDILLISENQLIISASELALWEQQELARVVDEGHLNAAVMEPLSVEQMRQAIEGYINAQGNQWRHTAGQIMQLIDRSRLRYLCPNPLVLFALLAFIDGRGVELGKTLDTRGRVLQAYIAHKLNQAQSDREGANATRTAKRSKRDGRDDIVTLLGQIAIAARWSHSPGAISLPVDTIDDMELLAEALHEWLTQHPLPDSASDSTGSNVLDSAALSSFLRVAKDASLIDVIPLGRATGERYEGCILRFRHALFADYFVAEYLKVRCQAENFASSTLFQEILAQLDTWCWPLALLAGLVDTPLQLAEQLSLLAVQHTQPQSFSAVQALLGSLICIGVAWMPPQAATQHQQSLPRPVADLFLQTMQQTASREAVARLFTDCTAAGMQELSCALFALLTIDGTEEFFPLLDTSMVIDFLFTYLRDTVEVPVYETQVKRLCRTLWQFGAAVVPTASALSRPEQGKSMRLRVAAVNILGGTHSQAAVEPLIDCLAEPDGFLLGQVKHALERLGPEISLPLLLQALENGVHDDKSLQIHLALLDILHNFLSFHLRSSSPNAIQLSVTSFQPTLETLLDVFTSRFATEPELQQQARHILVQQGRFRQSLNSLPEASHAIQEQLSDMTIMLLLRALSSNDDALWRNASQTLQEIGPAALSPLADMLDGQPTDIVAVRIIDILKTSLDLSALPALLRCVGNVSPFVQQHVTEALHSFMPKSIEGLIWLVIASGSMPVAEQAAHILSELGDNVVEPVVQALFPIVLQRTNLLAQVLVQVHDPRAVPALIKVLRTVREEALAQGAALPLASVLFAVSVLRALSQFADPRGAVPLIQMLALPQSLIYEEAIDALSNLGSVVLPGLLASLDVQEENLTTMRVRRAILGISPFPAEALISAFRDCTDAQARQIIQVLSVQGIESAQAVVRNLLHEKPRIQRYTEQALLAMPGSVAVPALLEKLDQPAWQGKIISLLLKFPEAMPPLVDLLGDPDHAEIAADILQQFGPDVLGPLISALNDPRMEVQDYAHQILIDLTEQQPANIFHIIHLFSNTLPLRAHEVLLEVLTTDLAGRSIPALLDGLADAYLINDVSEALMRLSRRSEWQRDVLHGLLASLHMPERRRGTETALIKVGAPAVQHVGALITDEDQAVAEAAQHVLREIGTPALSYIWTTHHDASNSQRRDVATRIFRAMPTDVIKDALVWLLSSDEAEDITMALAILLERVHDEASLPSTNQELVPSLLEYIQIHERERTSLRAISLLFLLGDDNVSKHLVRALYEHPEHHDQLAFAFLFLGNQSQVTLREILNDENAAPELRAEAMGILALLQPTVDVFEYAQALSQYGFSPQENRLLLPNQLAISLRALGGLLTRGEWDVTTLQNLRNLSQEGSPQHELFSTLLGRLYAPAIAELEKDLQFERDARKTEIMSLTARIVQDQDHISNLESLLEQLQHEHGIRSYELNRVTQDREHIRTRLHEVLQENQQLKDQIEDLKHLTDTNED
jgi:HEAT repeat protein